MNTRIVFLMSAVTLSVMTSGAHAQLSQAPNLSSLLQPEIVTVPPGAQGSAAGNVSTRVTVNGQIRQDSSAAVGGASQAIAVGSVRNLLGTTGIATDATLIGSINQTQEGSPNQVIDIAGVERVGGAGQVQTSALVSADLAQEAAGRGAQSLLVASVQGGAPTSANTRAVVTGNVRQSARSGGVEAGSQTISIAGVERSTGRASTDAVVGATLIQQSFGSGGALRQDLSIGSVADSSGTVQTRAVVEGTISQFLSSTRASSQQIHIGSVRGVNGLNVRTDVVVNGTISQTNGTSSTDQSILLGSVMAN